MTKICDRYIREVIRLADELLAVADAVDAVRTDVGCGILCGTLRDSAYKIKELAQAEIESHQARRKKKDPPRAIGS